MGNINQWCKEANQLDDTYITFSDNHFIVPQNLNFGHPSTFLELDKASKLFCQQNNINTTDYVPLISRLIAFKHYKIFEQIWMRLKNSKKIQLLNALKKINYDLMDSLKHYYFTQSYSSKDKITENNISNFSQNLTKSKKIQHQRKFIINSFCVAPSYTQIQLSTNYYQKGRQYLANNKVAVVFMCAGSSWRFGKQDKFFQPMGILGKKMNILDLMFQKLNKNITKKQNLSIFIICNNKNKPLLQKYFKLKQLYSFQVCFIDYLISNSYPLFDLKGEFCINDKFQIVEHSSGTMGSAQKLLQEDFFTHFRQQKIDYIFFSGAQNIFENPCDPCFIGKLIQQKKKVGAKCTPPSYMGQEGARYYFDNYEDIQFLNEQNVNKVKNSIVSQLPIAINSLIFEREQLIQLLSTQHEKLFLPQRFSINQTSLAVYDFESNKVVVQDCYYFQKDIRYLATCSKSLMLYNIAGSNVYAPMISNQGENSLQYIQKYHIFNLEVDLKSYNDEIKK